MKLTKEECLKALENIGVYGDLGIDNKTNEHIGNVLEEEILILEKLFAQHFYNIPLKFEELEEGMWVWVYRESAYRKILCTQTLSGVQFVIIDMFDKTEKVIRFKSTEFYEREVKE